MTVAIGLTTDIAACQAVRRAVFVEEQGVDLAIEQDGLDATAHHILAQQDGENVGAARVLIKGETGKIGRVCVLRDFRGQGLGAGLIQASLDHLATIPGVRRAELGAQIQALRFYQSFGFEAIGPEYQEANMQHQTMERLL